MPWLKFERMREATPTCGPSRAAFLLGRRSDHTGITTNGATEVAIHPLRGDCFNVWLKAAGIVTGIGGKWINGWDGTTSPETTAKYIPPGWDTLWSIHDEANQFTGFTATHDDGVGGYTTTAYTGNDTANYSTDVISTRLNAFITARGAGQRWFYYCNPFSPHDPFTPATRHNGATVTPVTQRPSELTADVSTQPAWIQALPELTTGQYNSSTGANRNQARRTMLAVDDMLDSAIATLVTAGRYATTDIIMVTDNGTACARYKRLTSATENAKSSHYPEMSNASCVIKPATGTPTAVLFIMLDDMPHGWHLDTLCCPKLVARMAAEGTTTVTASCSTVDLTATILDRFGVNPAAGIVLDGASLDPFLRGVTPAWPTVVESCVRHTDANTSIWWGVDDAFGNVYTEHSTSVANANAGIVSERELYPLGEATDCLVNEAGNPTHAALQASLAADLAALKAKSHGQQVDAGRPRTSATVKSKWRVAYGGVPVEARARVA